MISAGPARRRGCRTVIHGSRTTSPRWPLRCGAFPKTTWSGGDIVLHRRTVRLTQAAVALLALLTLAAATGGLVALGQRDAARGQAAIALSRQLAAESLNLDPTDAVTARRLAVAAWSVSPTSQAESAMTTLLTEQQQDGILPDAPSSAGVIGVAFSPGGKLLAAADGDDTVRLWNPVTGQPVRAPLHASANDGVNGVAFSPDGKLLASADGDGTVRLWNPATGQPVGAPSPDRLGGRARGGVQPGRQAAGQRRRRRQGAAVEPGHRPARRRAPPGPTPAPAA